MRLTTSVRQITFGPRHHFYGYIGHVGNTPWNGSGRSLVALRTTFQDRMPAAGDAADIVLLDAHDDDRARVVERTRAWNFQQGTMLYWNPAAAETQFFFNDRDPQTNEVFCVLFEAARNGGRRVAEFRHEVGFGNSGVARQGGAFLGINYARLARLRPVTGYPEAHDATRGGDRHPKNDGVFHVDVRTKQVRLLVSFQQLAEVLRPTRPDVDEMELFINHTLWSRDDSNIYFFVRGAFDDVKRRIDVPLVMRADGSQLRPLGRHIGGHPEWESGRVLIGSDGKGQILYDVERNAIVDRLGTEELFPKPGGDVALSFDGRLFVNGHGDDGKNYYTILRRADGAWTRTAPFSQGGHSGDRRVDPAPCWNRDGTQLAVTAIDEAGTRQMFVIDVASKA